MKRCAIKRITTPDGQVIGCVYIFRVDLGDEPQFARLCFSAPEMRQRDRVAHVIRHAKAMFRMQLGALNHQAQAGATRH